MIGLNVCSNLRLPLVAIAQQFLLIVKQLLVCLCRKLKVRSLNDGVDRTSLLTESTVNTLRHVDIVTSRSSAAIGTLFSFDGDRLSRANCLTEFASDATLLTAWIATKCMLTAESRTQWSLLEWIIDGGRFFEDVSNRDSSSAEEFSPEDGLSCKSWRLLTMFNSL